jgi:hypothetical protein
MTSSCMCPPLPVLYAMNTLNPAKYFLRKSLLTATLCLSCGLPSLAGPVLKGNVTEHTTTPGQSAPGLSRSDLNRGTDDPFGNGRGDDAALAPPSFQVESRLPPAPPKRSFPLNADADGQGDQFDPQMQNGVGDRMPQQQEQPPRQMNTVTPNNFGADPDATPDMQLAWDAWHKRVAAAVYERYSALSNAAFSSSRRPLMATASYFVTRDGRIGNAQLVQRSWNPIYNTLILGVINSISGNMAVLSFPPGSHRNMVEKTATFSQNYGPEGFRFTTGDKETVRQGR